MKNPKAPSEMSNAELAACIETVRLAPAKYLDNKDLNFHRLAVAEAARRLRAAKNGDGAAH